MIKKILRILLNPILIVCLFVLYLYFIIYSTMSYFSLKDVVNKFDFSSLYKETINLNSSKMSNMINDVTKEIIINSLYRDNYSSKDVLNLVDENMNKSLGPLLSSLPAANELKSSVYLELNNLKNGIIDVKETNEVSTIIDVTDSLFSRKTCNIFIGITSVVLMILLILNSSFKWVRINSIVMFLSSLFYITITNTILNNIPVLAKNINIGISSQNVIVNALSDVLTIAKQGISTSVYFIIISIITFVLYITVFKTKVNKLK